MSQSSLPLYVGLGEANAASAIEVRWPSGKQQTIAESVAAGETIDVVEP